MSDERVVLTIEDAIACLPENCHITTNPRVGVVVGGDCSREDAEKIIHEAALVEIGGDICRAAGHGIVVWERHSDGYDRPRFISHDEERLDETEKRLIKNPNVNTAKELDTSK